MKYNTSRSTYVHVRSVGIIADIKGACWNVQQLYGCNRWSAVRRETAVHVLLMYAKIHRVGRVTCDGSYCSEQLQRIIIR